MLHIILVLLKIIGILLGTLLGLILLAAVLVLCVPVQYRVSFCKNNEKLGGSAAVSWLFHIISVKVCYDKEKGMEQDFCLFGISLLKLLEKRKKKRAEAAGKSKKRINTEEEKLSHSKKQSVHQINSDAFDETEHTPKQERQHDKKTDSEQTEQPLQAAQDAAVPHDTLWEKAERLILRIIHAISRVLRGIISIPLRVLHAVSNFWLTVRDICGKIRQWRSFLNSPEFKAARKAVLKNGRKLLRHVLPKQIRGSVHFGFDDPSFTGQVLAAISLAYPVLPRKLTVIPDFNGQILEADVSARGRIYGIVLVKLAVQTYFQSRVKEIIKQYKEAF